MDHSSAAAYVYAKASGMLSKSFVGPRTEKLFAARSLNDLWTLLFRGEVPLVPEALLAKQIEKKAEQTFISDFITLLNSYDKPDPVLIQLFRLRQYKRHCRGFVRRKKRHAADYGHRKIFDARL